MSSVISVKIICGDSGDDVISTLEVDYCSENLFLLSNLKEYLVEKLTIFDTDCHELKFRDLKDFLADESLVSGYTELYACITLKDSINEALKNHKTRYERCSNGV